MSKIIDIALRTWQFICALIVMSLIGNMIDDASAGNPSSVNYTMFCSVFAMLSLIWLLPAAVFSLDHFPWIAAPCDILNTIFWLGAAIALAAKLHVHSCTNYNYLVHNEITNGAHNMTKRCREGQASDAFLWFGFAAFAVSAAFSTKELLSGSGSVRRGMGSSGPSMRQV